jgi:cyclophilin family peptidyl-prolyl cis-trans isomerase
LISTVNDQVNKFKNNPDYLESLQSLISLSGRISKDFSSRIIGILKDSKIYAVKKTAFLKSGLNPFLVKKDTTGFSRFWSDAFKYKSARVVTPSGNFTMKFFPGIAPISVGNFCRLAEKGFFDNIVFHRVVPGFVIQGGDPEGNGWGGPGYDITSEFSPLNYNPGMVGMASAGKDTEGSQWFVTTGNFPHLDGRYTIFGEVTRGMEIVNRTLQGDKIIKVIPEN